MADARVGLPEGVAQLPPGPHLAAVLNHCNGSRCGLVAMHNRYADTGDSGGPWFYNNTAYGIHQGSKWWNFKYRDLYTPVVYLPSALGASVATS